MKFQVPQFIEVEDKIFGPLTLKQFIYMAGGAGLSLIFYMFFSLVVSMVFIIPIMSFAAALAFYKINNRPFVFTLEQAFNYLVHPKLYIWHQTEKKAEVKSEDIFDGGGTAFIPKLSDSKLKDLSWTLDAKGAANPLTKDTKSDTMKK